MCCGLMPRQMENYLIGCVYRQYQSTAFGIGTGGRAVGDDGEEAIDMHDMMNELRSLMRFDDQRGSTNDKVATQTDEL